MRTEYFITMDVHSRTTDSTIRTKPGKLVKRERVNTGIPQIRQIIESVPHPRYVAIEEGSLSGWIYRNVKDLTDKMIVCDPRRNAYIAKDGDKDDPIDSDKLNELLRGGFLKAVHQLESDEKAADKQLIGMYHDRTARRVSEGNQLLSLGKRWGMMLTGAMIRGADARQLLETRLEQAKVPLSIGNMAVGLWTGFHLSGQHEQALYEQVCQLVQNNDMMKRTAELTGYGPIRAATLIAYLDTPWRFRSKSALWKYVGIGLRRESSGDTKVIRVAQDCNRLLRNMVIGAAQTAILQKENEFAERYAQWIKSGLSFRNARRNVARCQVTAIWGMWKSGKAYDPGFIQAPNGQE